MEGVVAIQNGAFEVVAGERCREIMNGKIFPRKFQCRRNQRESAREGEEEEEERNECLLCCLSFDN